MKSFNVVALDRPLKLHPKAPDVIEVDFERKIELTVPEGKIFALEEEATTVAGNVMPNPLTLRANLGDCIKINLKNKMKASRASFFAPGLAFDPKDQPGPERRQQRRRSDHRSGRKPELHLLRASGEQGDDVVGVGRRQHRRQST